MAWKNLSEEVAELFSGGVFETKVSGYSVIEENLDSSDHFKRHWLKLVADKGRLEERNKKRRAWYKKQKKKAQRAAWLKTENGKRYLREKWRRQNKKKTPRKEKQREYTKRWKAKNKEHVRAKARVRYHARRVKAQLLKSFKAPRRSTPKQAAEEIK